MECDAKYLSAMVAELLRPLNDVRTEEYYKYIIFTGGSIISYNDRICAAFTFPTPFKRVIPAKEFYSLLPKTGTIDISGDRNSIVIKSKQATAKIASAASPDLISSIESINPADVHHLSWKPIPEDFMEGLSMCYPAASKEMVEIALTCVRINDDKIISTDDLRVSEFTLSEGIGEDILIPAKSARELCMHSELYHYFIDDPWIYFTHQTEGGGTFFCARLVQAEFGDHEEHFEFEKLNELVLPTKETMVAINYVAPLAKEDEYGFTRMKVSTVGNKIVFKTEDPNIGYAEYEVKADKKSKRKLTFEINPSFMLHIMKYTDKMIIGSDRALFETSNFRHLVSLFEEE